MQVKNKYEIKDLRRKLRRQMNVFEYTLWNCVRGRRLLGVKFYRQYSIGKYIVDFYCPEKKLVIEIDGGQHYDDENIVYDLQRTEYLESLGMKVIRFNNREVRNQLDDVLNMIAEILTPL